jgi:ABC-2 type transport system permease protein
VVLAGLATGVATWAGAASQHTGVSLGTMLEAGLNASVPGVFVVGAGVLVLGIRPQLTAAACYGIVAWSFLIDVLAALLKGADWLRDSSLFTHIAIAPAARPDWGSDISIVLLGLGLAVIGALALKRRDIEYA